MADYLFGFFGKSTKNVAKTKPLSEEERKAKLSAKIVDTFTPSVNLHSQKNVGFLAGFDMKVAGSRMLNEQEEFEQAVRLLNLASKQDQALVEEDAKTSFKPAP